MALETDLVSSKKEKFNRKDWMKTYRSENKDKIDVQLKVWKEKNKDSYSKYQKEFQKERYVNNREKMIKGQLTRTIKYRDTVYAHYGNVCVCCGETNPFFLTVDHVNNDGNKHLNGKGNRMSGTSLYLRIIKDNYPDNFQILCMNCNFGKARNKGVCPHKQNYGSDR